MNYGCCNCGEDIFLDKAHMVCSDCGGFVCHQDCLDEHECDEEGDM